MNYSDLKQCKLVNTPDGIGIFLKIGVRQVLDKAAGFNLEKVALVLINNETKWYDLKEVTLVD